MAELAPLEEAERTAQIEKLSDQGRTAARALLGNRKGGKWSPYAAARLEGYSEDEARALVAELAPLAEVERKAQRVRTFEEEEEEELI